MGELPSAPRNARAACIALPRAIAPRQLITMSDIFVVICNQENNALTSIDGIVFVALLEREGKVLAQETVDLIYADAGFDDLSVGQYTVVVRHDLVEPQATTYNVTINSEDEVILLTFIYLEPERVFLRIRAAVEKRL